VRVDDIHNCYHKTYCHAQHTCVQTKQTLDSVTFNEENCLYDCSCDNRATNNTIIYINIKIYNTVTTARNGNTVSG
jgi:hypothetical protein